MKRVIFVLGLGVGFVLGARAGRERYEQIAQTARRVAGSEPVQRGVATAQQVLDEATPVVAEQARRIADQASEASKRMASRLGEGAAHMGEAVHEHTTDFVERVTAGTDDLQERVTHTTDELRRRSDELRRRSEEQLERGREAQADGLVWAGERREQALAEIVTDDDDMVEPRER